MRCLNFTKVTSDMTIAFLFLFIINNLTLIITLTFTFFLKSPLEVWGYLTPLTTKQYK